jgi:peptidoglycan-associated lipoprotein
LRQEGAAAGTAAAGTTASGCCATASTATATAATASGTCATTAGADGGRALRAKTVDQLNAEMPLGDVFFDYDMSTVRDDARPILQRNADYLAAGPTTRITVEGHADARGTNEYNLSLGERRANSVKEYLVSLGIGADRMLAVSKGEESPVCTEMTEDCYTRNRRAHFVFTAK